MPPIPISVPAAGSLAVASTQMEVGAVLDVQKTNEEKGYLRLVSCYIRKGATVAKVENMGLLTNIVNLKYQVIFEVFLSSKFQAIKYYKLTKLKLVSFFFLTLYSCIISEGKQNLTE